MTNVFDVMVSGDVAALRELVAGDPMTASVRDEDGLSAVLYAQYRGRQDMVAILLEAHPDLDLFDASALGDATKVTAILDADPDQLNAWSPDGFTPLHLAVFFGHVETARLLVDRGAALEAVSTNRMAVMPIHSAVAGRSAETVELLLASGVDVNAPSHAGFTPLLDAAQNGDREIVEALLAHGADPSASLDNGKTAKDLALANGHEDVAELLTGDR